jgi:prefoldin subunit 5
MDQAQLTLDRTAVAEAQALVAESESRLATELADLSDLRERWNEKVQYMEKMYASLQKEQLELERATETIASEWQQVEKAREQVKDLLADAAQRMIPILQKLEQLRKENWLRSSSQHRTSSFSCSRGSEDFSSQRKGVSSYETWSPESMNHRHFGARKDGDQYSEVHEEYEPPASRRSTLELYRERNSGRHDQGSMAAAGPSAGVPARGHGPKFSNWDNFRALPISLGHLALAKFEFAQVDQYNAKRVDGQALARWILETDPYSMRNLIPGQIKLMFQAVDTMNTGYISFWGFLAIQLFVSMDLQHFNMFEWLNFVNLVSHPKHELTHAPRY